MAISSFGTLPESDQNLADVLSLYDLANVLDIRDMTLGSPYQYLDRKEVEVLTLEDYSFLNEITFSEVVQLTNSYKRSVDQFPLALVAFEAFLSHPVLAIERKLTLAQVMKRYPDIGDFKLNFLDLEQYGAQKIPGLLSIPIMQIPGWGDIKVSEIPGLERVSIDADDNLDGKIVELTVSSEGNQKSVILKDDTGLSLAWSEKPEDRLSPFESYFIVPTISGEEIAVSAYFQSCDQQGATVGCRMVGPFPYGQYTIGDHLYVSARDWSSATREIQTSAPETAVEESSSLDTVATASTGQAQFIKVLIVTGTGITLLGILAFYLILKSLYRRKV